jgi:hypothetical protein
LVVGGLLPARERDRKIREENEHVADEVLDLKDELRKRRDRIDDRKHERHVTERELRERGGLRDGEVPLPPEAPAPEMPRAPTGEPPSEQRAP